MRFLIYENYEDLWKIGLFFWWRHNRSRWRHNILVFNGSRDLGLIFQQKKFLGGLDQPAACWISYKTPYFSDFNLWKTPHFKKKKSPTKPGFPLSRQRWVRWLSQIWWLHGVERLTFYCFRLSIWFKENIFGNTLSQVPTDRSALPKLARDRKQ